MIHSAVQIAISKVEGGHFDDCLKGLQDTALGISVNCYVKDGIVAPIPTGLAQRESDLRIHVTDQADPNSVQVGWFSSAPSICSGHPSCEDYKHADDDLSGKDVLAEAPDLHPDVAAIEAGKRREVLANLHQAGLGLFLLHGHSRKHEFTELPKNFVAVVENERTHFRSRKEALASERFVPTTWRMEDGVRLPVGGCIL